MERGEEVMFGFKPRDSRAQRERGGKTFTGAVEVIGAVAEATAEFEADGAAVVGG